MKVAVLSATNRLIGGVEEYLRRFLSAAAGSGHEVGFWYETDIGPADRGVIPDPPAGGWPISAMGHGPALEALRQWRPDVIYAHGVGSPELEEKAYQIAPTVYFAHVYIGTCISGAKTTWFPTPAPCSRTFGPPCLVHYFPRRCGGLNPLTMVELYRVQSRRLAAIRGCAAVVTHSAHMHDEYVRHGVPPERVYSVPFFAALPAGDCPAKPSGRESVSLLFLGRMEACKGGNVLLDALPRVRQALKRPLRVVFAGEGRERSKWERHAREISTRDPLIRVEFTGWVDAAKRAALFRETDLLVVPSIWPEPFGQVGPEAGMYGVPVAAFAVGGTPSWLTDGENGFLAPGAPPRVEGIAVSIVRCLEDPARHARLRAGALRLANRFTWERHFEPLMAVLGRYARNGDFAARGEPAGPHETMDTACDDRGWR